MYAISATTAAIKASQTATTVEMAPTTTYWSDACSGQWVANQPTPAAGPPTMAATMTPNEICRMYFRRQGSRFKQTPSSAGCYRPSANPSVLSAKANWTITHQAGWGEYGIGPKPA